MYKEPVWLNMDGNYASFIGIIAVEMAEIY